MRARTTDNYKWLAFATIAVGVYSWVLDNAEGGGALPSISAHFSADLPTVQWVVLVYLLTITALLLPMGAAADAFGRRRLYLAGFGVYVAGALVAAAAQNMSMLLAARCLQAVGSAAVQGNGMAIAVSVFPPGERGKVLGLNALVVAIAATTGPVFGGLLIDQFGWRAPFVTTGVLASGALAMGLIILRDDRPRGEARPTRSLDRWGMGLSAIAMLSTFMVLSRGHTAGWTSAFTLTAAVLAVASISAFILVELRSPAPMIDLALYKLRRFTFGTAANYVTFIAVSANTYMFPFYLQGVRGFSASKAGLLSTPFAITLGIVSPFMGRLSDRIGPRVPSMIGMTLNIGAMLAFSRLGADSAILHVVLPSMALGAGMATFSAPNNSSVMGTVPREKYGIVSGLLNLMRNMGQVTSVAVATLVISMAITAMGATPDLGTLRKEGAAADPALVDGFVKGFRQMCLISVGTLSLAMFLSAFPEKSRGERRAAAEAARAQREAEKAAPAREQPG